MKGIYLLMIITASAILISGQSSEDKPSTDERQDPNCSKIPSHVQAVYGFPGFPGFPGPKGDTGPKGDIGPEGPPTDVGVVYTRWGHSSCPGTLVYSGRTGGPRYTEGGGANFLCMPDDPEYELPYTAGVQTLRSAIYGVEYEFPVGPHLDQNAPCAVCYTSNKTISLMIPAKANCPSGWTREYYGYLMSAYRGRDKRSQYICVDKALEGIPGLAANNNDAVVYHVEASCKGLSCGPYDPAKELNCVVCTK